MKLYYDKRLKDPTYYIQQGFRKGKKTSTRNVRRIGKHSELLKMTDDPLAYAKKEVEKMNEEFKSGRIDMNVTFNFNEKLRSDDRNVSSVELLNTGYFFLQYVYGQLNMKKFFSNVTKDSSISFDCDTVNRFLTYGRILDPRSKLGTFDRLDSYYEQPKFAYQHILRFMDILSDHYDEYLTWLYENSANVVKRDNSVFYYDCTNYYFETEQADPDIIDEVTGEVISGLRQFGISKQHQPSPLVEMGLLMDGRGVPVSMTIVPGNTSEQVTAIPLEKDVIKNMGCRRFIYCADAGLGSYNIRRFNSMGGRAFIVTQSIKKLPSVLKEAVFNDFDYHLLSNDDTVSLDRMKTFDRYDRDNLRLYEDRAYKVISADRLVDLGFYEKNEKGRKVKAKGGIEQRLIITFSRKMMEYQRSVRKRQLERAKAILERNDPEEIKKGPNDVRRFLKRTAKDDNGKEAKVSYVIDEAKIAEEEKYDGFYAVATNLLDDPAKEILEISHRRYKIEDCFRVLKTSFSARPVYHHNQSRIKAHFMICYTALVIYRLLECLLDDQGTHVTVEELITTLRNMNVVNEHDLAYRAVYTGSNTLDALTKLTGIGLDFRYYKNKDLDRKIKKLQKVKPHTTK